MTDTSASTHPRSDAPPATRCRGFARALLCAGWGAGLLITLVPAVTSFIRMFDEGSLDLLTRAGAFALNPSIVGGLEDLGIARDAVLQGDLVFRILGMVVFSVTAIGIFVRRSDDWMTGLVSFTLLTLGMTWFAPIGALPRGSVLDVVARAVGNARPFEVGLGRTLAGITIIVFLYLFPDGRFVPRWTRYAAIALAAHWIAWNVFDGTMVDPTTWSTSAQIALVTIVVGSAVGAQIYRFFISSADQRNRTKLVVAAICVLAVVPPMLFAFNPGLGAGLDDLAIVTPRVEIIYNLILLVILGMAAILLPISIAVSVWRYRLWDMDIFINRTLVYGALTGVLGLTYFVILAAVSAVAQQSFVTAAAATFGVAVLFQPARRRLQDLIDKRFYRQRYDATKRLQAFASRLRQEIDLQTLTDELLRVVRETMHPTGVSLWVASSLEGATEESITMRRIGFWVDASRAGLQERDFDEVRLGVDVRPVFTEAAGPVDLADPDITAEALLRLRSVGVCLTVPLVNQGELIGILNLGRRMSDADYSSDDLRLLDDLSDHAAVAIRVALLVGDRENAMRERERIDNEMRVARLIQQRFFPKELPSIPGWEIYAYLEAARDVGGDFYDFIDLPDGRLVIVAGDVTGKGVPAALVMASTRSLLRSESPRLLSPATILEHVNESLLKDIPEQMFVTCLCAVLDPATGRLLFANAGHNVPYLRVDEEVVEARATGLPLGLMPGIQYEECETTIALGVTIMLHSDGLAEARNETKEMYGFSRVKESLQRATEPKSTITALLADLAAFTGDGWEQDDDITLAVIHRRAQAESLPAGPREEKDGYVLAG
ncbi:MAG: SpoIIE family protein phosphatase [Actinomycetota bacterium]